MVLGASRCLRFLLTVVSVLSTNAMQGRVDEQQSVGQEERTTLRRKPVMRRATRAEESTADGELLNLYADSHEADREAEVDVEKPEAEVVAGIDLDAENSTAEDQQNQQNIANENQDINTTNTEIENEQAPPTSSDDDDDNATATTASPTHEPTIAATDSPTISPEDQARNNNLNGKGAPGTQPNEAVPEPDDLTVIDSRKA